MSDKEDSFDIPGLDGYGGVPPKTLVFSGMAWHNVSDIQPNEATVDIDGGGESSIEASKKIDVKPKILKFMKSLDKYIK